MKPKDVLMLLALAALWGASFLFVRIASPVLGPSVTIFLRVFVAAVALLVYLAVTRQSLALREHWRSYLGMGFFNAAVPFTLFAVALLQLNASYTSILNATAAFFTAIVAAIWLKDRFTLRKLVGVLLGMAGVIVLVGFTPVPLTRDSIMAVGLILLATFSYGIAAVFARRFGKGIAPTVFATGQQVAASIIMTPLLLLGLPAAKTPSLDVMGAILGVGLLCTALAYLLYYRLITNIGPTNALTVTFLIPVFGIVWGVLFLRERVEWNDIAGFMVILVGMGLVLGVKPSRQG